MSLYDCIEITDWSNCELILMAIIYIIACILISMIAFLILSYIDKEPTSWRKKNGKKD